MSTSNVAVWNMAFYGCVASLATPSTWWRLVVNGVVSALAAGRGAWPRVRHYWSMKSCPNSPSDSDQTTFNLADFFIGPNRFMLRVQGDSMIEPGILDGDMAIVEKCDYAEEFSKISQRSRSKAR